MSQFISRTNKAQPQTFIWTHTVLFKSEANEVESQHTLSDIEVEYLTKLQL